MSEISGGNDANMDVGSSNEVSSGETESVSSVETSSSKESSDFSENSPITEIVTGSNPVSSEVSFGTKENKGAEDLFVSLGEASARSNETTNKANRISEVPSTLAQAQKDVESYHRQSIEQILTMNGKYMSEADKARVSNGVDSIRAVQYDPYSGRTGRFLYQKGKTGIEVSAINQQQMERSTKHETNHFASTNREIIVPEPNKNGYTVYQTVGTRQSSWFHSTETGENSNFTTKGLGLNEGLTTMYTNQQLTELSKEKGEAAERQQIYSHATELCNQLEDIVGVDTLKEAYYGGNIQALESKVDSLAGEKGFESLCDCLDRTLSKDPVERVQAMKEAQSILAKMFDEGGN